MERKLFLKILDELFKKYSLVKSGTTWTLDEGSFIKIIKTVKSKYGNYYQLNYGYILKKIELDGLEMHIFNSLSSVDKNVNARIFEVLDLDSLLSDKQRQMELEKYVTYNILEIFKNVATEDDIYQNLLKRATLNDIPIVVKKYFNIPY